MFDPTIAPNNSNLIFVACDMAGLYRSDNGGARWSLLDERVVQGFGRADRPLGFPKLGFSVAFHPSGNLMLASRRYQGLKTSPDGDSWTKLNGQPSELTNGAVVTGAALDSGSRFAVGTWDQETGRTNLLFFNGSSWSSSFSTSGHTVLKIVVVKDSSGKQLFFAATDANVLRYDEVSQTWTPVVAGWPGGTILGFAGSSNPTEYVLFATVFDTTAQTARVSRYMTSSPTWTVIPNQISGLTYGSGYYYELLSMATDNTQVVYVTGFAPPGLSPPNVWASTDGGNSWTGIYDGYQNHPAGTKNVVGGWLDWELGWGFGGPANGFSVAPLDTQMAIFSNNGAVYISRQNSVQAGVPPQPGSVQWVQAYSASTFVVNPPQKGLGWSSIGLEVTTTWDYVFHNYGHYICYTDISFAETYVSATYPWYPKAYTLPNSSATQATDRWGNWYQLGWQPNSNTMWAAVSQQHDLPYNATLDSAHDGALLRGSVGGASWYRVGNTGGLPSNLPIVSVVYGTPKGSGVPVLYAAVWGDVAASQNPATDHGGVYRSHDLGDNWTLVQKFSIGAYRLVFGDDQTLYLVVSLPRGAIYAMSSTDSQGNGGTFTEVANINGLRALAAGAPNIATALYPVDLTVRTSPNGGGNDLYLGTRGVGGSNNPNNVLAKVYKYDNASGMWFDMKVPVQPEYGPYPSWFGVYFIDSSLYVTSDGHGTWMAPKAQIEGVSAPNPLWTEVGPDIIPFLHTHRVRQDGYGNLFFTTHGGGVWMKPRISYGGG
jgi:hypothetical protein